MKYIFIDSSQYRHLFSPSEGFSDSVHDLLLKLINYNHVKLLLPQQTKEEVERNRHRQWPENEIKNLENQIEKLKSLLEKTGKELGSFKSYKKLTDEINNEAKRLDRERDKILSTFTNNKSKANQKLRKLFSKATIISENKKIRESAEIRFRKGNPPYGGNIGDSLIWESLLDYLENSKRAGLIFVASDKKAWGKFNFDQILQDEFKTRVKGRTHYINKLSDIPELTAEEQEKIKTEEIGNLKKNAVTDFVNSQSFTDAGEKANRLLLYKNFLTVEDYKDILQASLDNYEIYQSFFTAGPLRMLVAGNEDYVVKKIESLDSGLWSRFAKQYNISLKRQSDQPKVLTKKDEDIPF